MEIIKKRLLLVGGFVALLLGVGVFWAQALYGLTIWWALIMIFLILLEFVFLFSIFRVSTFEILRLREYLKIAAIFALEVEEEAEGKRELEICKLETREFVVENLEVSFESVYLSVGGERYIIEDMYSLTGSFKKGDKAKILIDGTKRSDFTLIKSMWINGTKVLGPDIDEI